MEFVYVVENNLTDEICDRIIQQFDEDRENQEEGVCGVGVKETSLKKTTDLIMNKHEHWMKEYDVILNKALHRGLDEYFEYIVDDITFGEHKLLESLTRAGLRKTAWQVQKYSKGDYFKWHADKDDNTLRELAVIWYLNDIDITKGGSTEFIYGGSITPKKGSLLIFPATWTYIHRGTELIGDQNKYIITSFLCNNGKYIPPNTVEDYETSKVGDKYRMSMRGDGRGCGRLHNHPHFHI